MPNVRPVKWLTTIALDQAITDGAQVSFNLSEFLLSATTKGATVVRQIYDINVRSDTLGAIKHVFWGTVWMTAEAVTAGGFPDPVDQTERVDWLIRDVVHTGAPNLGTEFGREGTQRLDIHSGRMARAEDMSLRMVVEDSGAAAGGVLFTVQARILFKLP